MAAIVTLLALHQDPADGEKFDRSVFAYQDPRGDREKFAQCSTCISRMQNTSRCYWLGPDQSIKPEGSCVMYGYGPESDGPAKGPYTKKELGYVEREVRCENCKWFDQEDGDCGLYEMLNKMCPDMFALDEKVNRYGCCNAQQAKG